MTRRARNQVSIAEARQIETNIARTTGGKRGTRWRWWQNTCGKILRANSFIPIHLPALPTKALNKRLPADLPDWIGIGYGPSRGRILVVESKTGRGEATDGQASMLDLLLAVPGVDGGVFYEHDRAELVALAGGNEIGG